MRRFFYSRRFLLGTLAMAVLLSLGATSVFAHSTTPAPSSEQTFTVVATKALGSTGGSATPAEVETITCEFKIDYPHASRHVAETVNVESHTTCDQPVTSITMETNLYDIGLKIGTNTAGNLGKSYLDSNAAADGCVDGQYNADLDGTVVFPPDYEPPTASGTATSSAYVTC